MQKYLLAGLLLFRIEAFTEAADAPQLGSPIAKIVSAAKSLVANLDETQRRKIQFEFKDEAQKKRWSNLPTGIVKREGARMGDLTETQRNAVWALLQAALSPSGYEKVRRIVEADEVLSKGGSGGARLQFGKDEYYVAFLGEPSAKTPWIIQFGGHHLGINITLAGERGTLAPSHTGVQPAIYEMEGKTIRLFSSSESDDAFAPFDRQTMAGLGSNVPACRAFPLASASPRRFVAGRAHRNYCR